MATRWRKVRVRRRVLRLLLAWVGIQVAVAAAGVLAARRLDEGDEGSTRIRRVQTTGGFELRPTNPELTRVQFDIAMGGAELDLTALERPATAVDLTLHVLMGGVGVKVPPDWRVWWSFHGVGGIGSDGGLERARDEHEADLRIHADLLFGGVGVEVGA